MEIRKVVNEAKKNYPKEKQISKKCITNNIPNKWLKAGLSSLIVAPLIKSNIFAIATKPVPIAGGLAVYEPISIQIYNIVCPIVQIVSIITFIVTGLDILITKIKSKKQNEPKKVKKWLKIAFIISIIMFILSFLIGFIITKIDY